MARKLDDIGFQSSPADPDVWLRPAAKFNGEEYYEWVLMYVDDILAISMYPTAILKSMEGDTVKYKNGKIGKGIYCCESLIQLEISKCRL